MDDYNVFDEFIADLVKGHKIHDDQFQNKNGFIRLVFVSKKPLPNVSKLKSMVQECIHDYEVEEDCTLEDVDISAKRVRIPNTNVFYLHLEASATHNEKSRICWVEVNIADHTEAYFAEEDNMPYIVDVKCSYDTTYEW